MILSSLTAISPIDGRYYKKTKFLSKIFSEYALIKFRINIEIEWLKKLSSIKEIKELHQFNKKEILFLDLIIKNFNEEDAFKIKNIEKNTDHDIKAIEYFLKEKLMLHNRLKYITEFIHFACTSEDINNLSYAIIIKKTKDIIIIPSWLKIINIINALAIKYKNIPILSRTHGQPASPTTMGKELFNIVYRLKRQLKQLKLSEILGKFNGAVGNYNAHFISYPNINWAKISNEFVSSFNIKWNPYTTQIEPHDYIAEFFHCIIRFNNILIDLNRDMWRYISINYFKQRVSSDKEIGSSTMPHKINPINFENSEGNLGISNSILKYISSKLQISRWQRDLTDSTVLRNIGMCISYSVIAYESIMIGISKIDINKKVIFEDLNNNWIILSEAIQTIMRKYKINNSYEKLKKITRGKKIGKKNIIEFIEKLNIPEKEKQKLKKISPYNYIGIANKLVY